MRAQGAQREGSRVPGHAEGGVITHAAEGLLPLRATAKTMPVPTSMVPPISTGGGIPACSAIPRSRSIAAWAVWKAA